MKSIYSIAAFSAFSAILAQEPVEDERSLTLSQAFEALDQELDERKFSAIVDMAYHKLEGNPNFMVETVHDGKNKRKNFAYMLQGYGCHCFPNGKASVGGKGKPVDALDEACRALYRCHKCVDIENPENTCDLDNGGYKYQLNAGGAIGCATPEKTPQCKSDQCSCDRKFAETVFDLWTGNDWSFNQDHWLNPRYVKAAEKNGISVFDYDATCVMGANVTPDACCGDAFPNKVPYNSGMKECCSVAAKPYNAATDVCCDSGVQSAAKGCF